MQFVAFNSRVVLWPAVRTKNKRGLREAVRLIHCHALRGGRPVARWGVEARVSRGGRRRGQVDNARLDVYDICRLPRCSYVVYGVTRPDV